MNWWAIFGAGLLAGATTCAVAQGGLLVGLINRQKKAAAEVQGAQVLVTAGATGAAKGGTKTGGSLHRRPHPPRDRRPRRTTSFRSRGSCWASS